MSNWLHKPSIVSLSPSEYMASVLKSASVSLTVGVFLGSALTTGIVVGVAAAWIANEKVLKRLKANALSMLTSARDAALSTREGKALHQTLLALPGAVPGSVLGAVPGGVAVPPPPGCSISRLNPAAMYCDATVCAAAACRSGGVPLRRRGVGPPRRAAHLDGGLFDRPPPEGFPVVLGQPPPFP